MKIIHCADLHLGSRLTSLPTGEIRETRKKELLKTFNRLLDYAKENGIKIVLFSGDVFDSDRPTKKDKTFFYNAIKANSDITFFYVRGNHDVEESLEESLDNLILFNDEWQSHSIDGVTISGIELLANNATSLYSSLSLDKEAINIVMMHGDVETKGKQYIDIKKLANKNIDYLALGHIHEYREIKIDSRGYGVYPGCLDGRGFDETGIKGFVVLDVEGNNIKHEFVPFNSRVIEEKMIDISSASNLYEAKSIVEAETKSISNAHILKIVLEGKVTFDASGIENDIYTFFKDKFFHLKVDSQLKTIVNASDYKNDLSLKGEFVRNVLSDKDITDEEKEEILNVGIKLLNGEELQ